MFLYWDFLKIEVFLIALLLADYYVDRHHIMKPPERQTLESSFWPFEPATRVRIPTGALIY